MKFINSLSYLFLAACYASGQQIKSCTEKNTIALTFDDGPYEYTTELIDTLNENDIKATFFINVENYWKDLPTSTEKQSIIKKAYDSGHQIAQHTWAHEIPSDPEEFVSMMNETDTWIENIIDERPAYFRAPRGDCEDDCLDNLAQMGYHTIQWDTDTNDWDISIGSDARVEKVKEFLTEQFGYKRSNYLVLMHDTQPHTVESIVPWLMRNKPEGYRFVSVAECLGNKKSMYISGHIVDDENENNLLLQENESEANSTLVETDPDDIGNLVVNSAVSTIIPVHKVMTISLLFTFILSFFFL